MSEKIEDAVIETGLVPLTGAAIDTYEETEDSGTFLPQLFPYLSTAKAERAAQLNEAGIPVGKYYLTDPLGALNVPAYGVHVIVQSFRRLLVKKSATGKVLSARLVNEGEMKSGKEVERRIGLALVEVYPGELTPAILSFDSGHCGAWRYIKGTVDSASRGANPKLAAIAAVVPDNHAPGRLRFDLSCSLKDTADGENRYGVTGVTHRISTVDQGALYEAAVEAICLDPVSLEKLNASVQHQLGGK